MNSTNLGTKLFCLGVILLLSAVLSDAHFDRQIRARPNKYCGTALVDTLGILCENGYNSLRKKSISNEDEYFDDQQEEHTGLQIPGFPFVPRTNSARMMSENSFRRFGRGVTDECCKKSCSIIELMSYCK